MRRLRGAAWRGGSAYVAPVCVAALCGCLTALCRLPHRAAMRVCSPVLSCWVGQHSLNLAQISRSAGWRVFALLTMANCCFCDGQDARSCSLRNYVFWLAACNTLAFRLCQKQSAAVQSVARASSKHRQRGLRHRGSPLCWPATRTLYKIRTQRH